MRIQQIVCFGGDIKKIQDAAKNYTEVTTTTKKWKRKTMVLKWENNIRGIILLDVGE